MNTIFIEGQFYKCDNDIFLYKGGYFNQLLNSNVYRLMGSPIPITLNCNNLDQQQFPRGEIITELNYKFFSNNNNLENNGVDVFIIGKYYYCLGNVFYIEANYSKRLVTDPQELLYNEDRAIMANCNELNKLPNYAKQDKTIKMSTATGIGIVGSALCLILIIIVILIVVFTSN